MAEIDLKKLNFIKRLKSNLMFLGFDFDLLGSHYVKDILTILVENPSNIHKLNTIIMKEIAVIGFGVVGGGVTVGNFTEKLWSFLAVFGVCDRLSCLKNAKELTNREKYATIQPL